MTQRPIIQICGSVQPAVFASININNKLEVKMNIQTPILGIDLGTTNSAIAIWDSNHKKAVVIPGADKETLTPSVLAFDSNSKKLMVGKPAMDRTMTQADDYIYSVKRFIGLSYQDEQVLLSKDQVTYRIEKSGPNNVHIRLPDRTLTPAQISSHILAKLKSDAEIILKRSVKDVVITVPAYFTESQRHATIDAGNKAGMNVRRLINEPTAAALAFDLGQEPQTVVVYDLGGGTFDVSIIEIKKGMYRVVATNGNNHLGGDDFDNKIVEWIKKQVESKYNAPLIINKSVEAMLREKSQKAKLDLSENTETMIELNDFHVGGKNDACNMNIQLNTDTFNSLVNPLVEETLRICDETLTMANKKIGITPSDISQILMVGGQTRSPFIRSALQKKYGWKQNDSVSPDHVVALGSAVLAGYLSKDPYLKKRMRLWDVIAQPLGIEIKGGAMKEIIKANQEIPFSTEETSEEYTNFEDRQSHIEFRIYQGKDSVARNNIQLGKVMLPLTQPYEKGKARVRCWFEIDWDGILEIHARELNTDAEEIVQKIDYFYNLSQSTDHLLP
jgi:molecular chaperone DnaK